HAVARDLVELGGLLAQGVDRAMDVGVRGLVITRHRLDHRPRLLAGGGGVEVDERATIDDPLEDRKVAPRLRVQRHPSAFASTVMGSVTQRIRVGRTSACSTPSTSPVPSAAASARARPSMSYERTSAEEVQDAPEETENR